VKKRTLVSLFGAIIPLMVSVPAGAAYDWSVVGVSVTVVEASYMPQKVTFEINIDASSSCTAGTWLTWTPQGADEATLQANANAIYAMLLAAKVSGTPVTVFGLNANCAVTYLHMGSG
jgi:hypothetical protein